VASAVKAARKAARQKWAGFGPAHVDSIVEVSVVDGHAVSMTPTDTEQSLHFDHTFEPADD
jgi:hypothetical protein